MLVINRKVGERVLVGSTWVTVVATRKGAVRLGFDGPDRVAREEVTDRPQGGKSAKEGEGAD